MVKVCQSAVCLSIHSHVKILEPLDVRKDRVLLKFVSTLHSYHVVVEAVSLRPSQNRGHISSQASPFDVCDG
jgi:hypothetical protein